MDSIKPKRKMYVKWKNILGLIVLVVIVFVVIAAASFIGGLMRGDCVEKEYLKVCFSVDKSTLAKHEVATIKTDVTNIGQTQANATVALKISPNLQNMSSLTQSTGPMESKDLRKLEFRVASKDAIGKFVVDIDVNKDGVADKELFLTVEQK